MCRAAAEGGQRCAAHTRPAYRRAKFGTPEWDEAAAQHASTPSGRDELSKELARLDRAPSRRTMFGRPVSDSDWEKANTARCDRASAVSVAIKRGRDIAAANRESAAVMALVGAPSHKGPKYDPADFDEAPDSISREDPDLGEYDDVRDWVKDGAPSVSPQWIAENSGGYITEEQARDELRSLARASLSKSARDFASKHGRTPNHEELTALGRDALSEAKKALAPTMFGRLAEEFKANPPKEAHEDEVTRVDPYLGVYVDVADWAKG